MRFFIPVGIIGGKVRGAIVTGGDADRYAKTRGGLQQLVELVAELLGGLVFRSAPTDRNDVGLVDRVGEDGVHHAEKALVGGVGCEVDDDFCARRDGAGHFDIEHDFDVGIVGIERVGAGAVLAAIRIGGGCYAWWISDAEILKVGG